MVGGLGWSDSYARRRMGRAALYGKNGLPMTDVDAGSGDRMAPRVRIEQTQR
ncbi:hypothetical protein [Streptomyces sp. NPDC046805]|uniref:hypothetical protein n=1 Tax=Streptomyces sp. NPDC046805 TaxID=3155134 RepID=UPI003407C101